MKNETPDQIVQEVRANHQSQLALCEVLESIADQLPRVVDRQQCLSLARQISPIVKAAHDFEEAKLFPYLLGLPCPFPNLEQSLERLRYEHWEDESFAEEISESLKEFGQGECEDGCEKLAYMLRGFFEGLRRHMAFENEHLLPMLEVA
ncbi:MAG: hemerythrin domain-containing protein [Rhizobiaceae bacterium]